MAKQVIDNLQNNETFQLSVNNSDKFNKGFFSLALDNMFLGWLTNIKINEFSLWKNIKDSLNFTIQPKSLQSLEDTNVRLIHNSVLVRGNLCNYYQVLIDGNFNRPTDIVKEKLLKLVDFVEFLRNTDRMEIFWYDRAERVQDYKNYIDQLDLSISDITQTDPNGIETTVRLRHELEDTMAEIICKYKTRIREAFLIIPVRCEGKSIEDVENARKELTEKSNRVLKAMVDSEIIYKKVEGEHLHWFLSNFISSIVKF